MEKLPNYEQINNVLLESRIFTEAAEAHGLLVGLLVCNLHTSAESWVTIATENADAWKELSVETQTDFEQLCKVTITQLNDPELNFELLLPTDEELLTERAHAVGLWCKGFVVGVEYHGNYLGELMSKAQEDVEEALNDLQSIAEMDYNVKAYEEHEKSLTSVIEYVRVAVLLMQRELSINLSHITSGSKSLH